MAADLIKSAVKQYLYGSSSVPANLVSDNLIRADDLIPHILLSGLNYMTVGGGRFAKASQFALVADFLNTSFL